MLSLSLYVSLAHAQYAVPIDGRPNPEERELHAWTNAVRVDPEAFALDYPCGIDSFQDDERLPERPLLWEAGLNEAARVHTQDMYDTGNFSHTSSDGTSFSTRVSEYYASGFVGENIAWNYPSPWSTMIEGWMCSSGHRANIMDGSWEELGTGVVDAYSTQDFGARGINQADQPIRMAATSPAAPFDEAMFLADWYDPTGAGPARLQVVFADKVVDLELTWGVPESGMYSVTLAVDGGCTTYVIEGETSTGRVVTFPEEGAYGFGSCGWDDAEAQWLSRDDNVVMVDDGVVRDWQAHMSPFGCATQPGLPGVGLVLGALALLRRRR